MYIRTEFTNHAQVICASQLWYPWGQENHKRRMTYACAHKVHHAQVAFASSLWYPWKQEHAQRRTHTRARLSYR